MDHRDHRDQVEQGCTDVRADACADEWAVEWAEAWAAALDELEQTLEATESLLRGAAVEETPPVSLPWSAPALEGPMPVDLRTRALQLHHRQQEVLRATALAAVAVRRQAALADKLSSRPREAVPVYLDITA